MTHDNRLTAHLHVLHGAVNTGLLVADERALLFDCCDTVTKERLRTLGVQAVETILCTQHRRTNVSGAYPFADEGARIVVPAGERRLFEDVDAYWGDPKNRWHLYHHQPGQQVLARSLPVARTVSDGDVVSWRGYHVRVLDTPGATDGWSWDEGTSTPAVVVPPNTDGGVESFWGRPDGAVRLTLKAPADADEGLYVVPFRVAWDGRYLGQYRHAVVHVVR